MDNLIKNNYILLKYNVYYYYGKVNSVMYIYQLYFQKCVFNIIFMIFNKECIALFYFFYYQFSSKTFLDFVCNTNDIISDLNKKNIYLKEQLNNEKEKNKLLTKELNFEKNKFSNLNNELILKIQMISQLNSQINSLQIELNSTKIKLQNLLDSYNKLKQSKSNFLKPGEIIMAVNITTTDQKFYYPIVCKNTDIFAKLEEKLYNEYPEYKEMNTYFNVNGSTIKRFKSMDENKIKNADLIILNVYE